MPIQYCAGVAMHQLSKDQWIAIAAHRLQHRWRSIDPVQLDDLAGELYGDAALQVLDPAAAIDAWLAPLSTDAPQALRRA